MDKKFIYIAAGGLLIVIILIIALVSSGGKKTTTTAKTNTLTVWDYHNQKSAYDQIINSFQQDRNLKVQYITKNPATYLDDAVNAIAAGTGPDVMIVPANILPSFKDKLVQMPPNGFADPANKLNDIEGYQRLYPSVVSNDNIFNNQIYGAPMSIDYLKLYVNPAIINQALNEYYDTHSLAGGAAFSNQIFTLNTWDSLVNTVKFVTKKSGNKINRSAIALGTSDNIPVSNDILTAIMMQNGAKMTSDDLSTAQFHTKQNTLFAVDYPGTNALKFYTSFADPESPNYTWNSSEPDAVRAFAEGKTAMLIDYGSAVGEIANITPNLTYQVLDLPQITETQNPINIASYDTFVVTKSSADPLMAWRFIKKCIDPLYTSSALYYTKQKNVINNNDPNFQILISWYNPDPTKVEALFKDIIAQVNKGNNPQTAIDGAAGQVTTLLGKLKTP